MDRILIPLLAVLVLAAGCTGGEEHWNAKDISGLMPDLQFAMTDDRGRAASAADYRGKVVLLFFGYSSCADVCPTTLARLAEARQAMPDRGERTRVLFVTVDPARDTQARLAEYVRGFGAGTVGLRGSPEALDALARRYRVGYALGKPDANGQYEVNHSSGVFVFDAAGRARLLIRSDEPVPAITEDLERLAGS
jgi:protein SCO1/2